MTKPEIIAAVLAGKMLVGAEWRSSIAKTSEVTDEKSKVTTTRKTIVHQVEINDPETGQAEPFEIVEPVQDNFNADKYNASPRPFKKGQQIVIDLISFAWSDFKKRYRGKGTPLPVD